MGHRHRLAIAVERNAIDNRLALDLASLAGRSDLAGATRIYGHAARVLADALEGEKNPNARSSLAQGLVSLARLTDQSDVATALVITLERTAIDNGLALDLASLSGRPDVAGASRIYGHAARVLATALKLEKDVNQRNKLRFGLASLAGRFDPTEAATIGEEVAARALPTHSHGM